MPWLILLLLALPLGYCAATRFNPRPWLPPGTVIDIHNGVVVQYNGGISHVDSRNLSVDGYNLGLRWQCVEFVKRYYFEQFGHRMPESRGHAKGFFDATVADGGLNKQRALLQFRNGGRHAPEPDDILVYGPWLFNPWGHVAIVTRVEAGRLQVVQQNPGPWGDSREWLTLQQVNGQWSVSPLRVRGWLRRDGPAVATKPTHSGKLPRS